MSNFLEGVRAFFAAVFVLLLLIVAPILLLMSIKWETSEKNVSGIVYNLSNDALISGNTHFSVRASENTYVSGENKSSYCLPPGSKYIELVNQAAEDKDIKVIVKTSKVFTFKAPWTCVDNVTVTKAE